MKAISLWRPWELTFFLPYPIRKRVENRRKPPSQTPGNNLDLGEVFALHAAQKYDPAAVAFIRDLLGDSIDLDQSRPGVIVGVVRFLGVVTGDGGLLRQAEVIERERRSPWFFGPYGWVVDDARKLAEPVPCKGRQGIWTVPADVAARVEEQLR